MQNKTAISASNIIKSNLFLVAGRTGGPFFPFPRIIEELENYNPIIIGVKNSYEQRISLNKSYKLYLLPEAKLNLLSFSNTSVGDKVLGFFDFMWNMIKLAGSFFICFYLILRHQPKLIYTTGSFLAVPLFAAVKVLNFVRLSNTKLALHQQDPLPGLSNKICVKLADLKSVSFLYTKSNYPNFADSYLINNPILESKYLNDQKNSVSWLDQSLFTFLNTSNKPTMLIFGGGTGARFINDWVKQNLNELIKDFAILHLTGVLQSLESQLENQENYYVLDGVFEDMPMVMKSVDYVVSRAGLGTITELQYLNKKAFLVPIPDSHQELNAQLVQDKFVILDQKKSCSWLNTIKNLTSFETKKFINQESLEDQIYFEKLKNVAI